MSRSEHERAWGTAGWLDDHELAGSGKTVLCQRKTKTHAVVARAAKDAPGTNVRAVYRKTFGDGDELCAAFLWGNTYDRHAQHGTLTRLWNIVRGFVSQEDVADAHVTTFLYDVPSGYWRAIVVFKRGAK